MSATDAGEEEVPLAFTPTTILPPAPHEAFTRAKAPEVSSRAFFTLDPTAADHGLHPAWGGNPVACSTVPIGTSVDSAADTAVPSDAAVAAVDIEHASLSIGLTIELMETLLHYGSNAQRAVVLMELHALVESRDVIKAVLLIPLVCAMVHGWDAELQATVAAIIIACTHLDPEEWLVTAGGVPAVETALAAVSLTGHSSLPALAPAAHPESTPPPIPPRPAPAPSSSLPRLEQPISSVLCEAAFRVIGTASDETILETWGEVLVAVLPQVQWSTDGDQLRRVVATLDVHVRPGVEASSRRLAARLYGSLSMCLDGAAVEEHILPRALSLCADVDIQVRGMLAESLAFVGAAVPVKTVEARLWPALRELLQSPDARIHAATLRTIAHVLQAVHEKMGSIPAAPLSSVVEAKFSSSLPVTTQGTATAISALAGAVIAAKQPPAAPVVAPDCKLLHDLLPPVFAKEVTFASSAAAEDQRLVSEDVYLLLEITAEVFGQLAFSALRGGGADDVAADAYRAFLAMATSNGPIVRRHCAYNLPGVCAALSPRFRTEMAAVVEYLARDIDPEVRWNVAAGLHAVAAILIPTADNTSGGASFQAAGVTSCFDSLCKAAVGLLQDEHPLVRSNTLDTLFLLLSSLSQACVRGNSVGTPRSGAGGNNGGGSSAVLGPTGTTRLASIFSNLTLLSEGSWRTQEILAQQLTACASFAPAEALRIHVLPLLLRISEESSYLVRVSAMQAVASSLLHIADTEQRAAAFQSFVTDWAQGNTFWKRIAFLEAAEAAAATYSRLLFRDLFAALALRMAWDGVPNVRLHLARILPAIAPACHQMEEFANALGTLRVDEDEDVVAQLALSEATIAARANNGAAVAAADREDARREDLERLRYENSLAGRPDSGKRRVFRRATKRVGKTAAPGVSSPSPAAVCLGSGAGEELPVLPPTLEEVGKSGGRLPAAAEPSGTPLAGGSGGGGGGLPVDLPASVGGDGALPAGTALVQPTPRRRASARGAEAAGSGSGVLTKSLTSAVLSSGGGTSEGSGIGGGSGGSGGGGGGGSALAAAAAFLVSGMGGGSSGGLSDGSGTPGHATTAKVVSAMGVGGSATAPPQGTATEDVAAAAAAAAAAAGTAPKKGRTPRGGSFLTLLKTGPRRKLKDTEATG
ncbi:hypothetical protein MMPV_000026 [Pyropia vietnamensis]